MLVLTSVEIKDKCVVRRTIKNLTLDKWHPTSTSVGTNPLANSTWSSVDLVESRMCSNQPVSLLPSLIISSSYSNIATVCNSLPALYNAVGKKTCLEATSFFLQPQIALSLTVCHLNSPLYSTQGCLPSPIKLPWIFKLTVPTVIGWSSTWIRWEGMDSASNQVDFPSASLFTVFNRIIASFLASFALLETADRIV